jgi:hypothetical protein
MKTTAIGASLQLFLGSKLKPIPNHTLTSFHGAYQFHLEIKITTASLKPKLLLEET